jgi:(5-formylfuran-3-yl)methyl phosphate synthase
MRVAPGLLVSVRSPAEAEMALAAGAAVIDVKDPARGALGRADDHVIRDVVQCVAGRAPVSAALGELRELTTSLRIPSGVTFIKLGLAGCADDDWRGRLNRLLDNGFGPGRMPQLVVAAYADWEEAQTPPLAEVSAFARSRPGNVLLVDTFVKGTGTARRTLIDWLPPDEVAKLCQDCRAAHVRIALAGSLGATEIARLRPANPDWFAVRGAACEDRCREATLSRAKLARLHHVVVGTAAELCID